MGLFDFLTHEIAIDLGTANTLIIYKGNVVVDEPSIVARDRATKKVIAVGTRAMQMFGKTHKDIETIRPLKDGVIADFEAAEEMLRQMIKMLYDSKRWITPQYKMVICIPSGITEVEKEAVFKSAEKSGSRESYLVHEPMAAALGIGIDVGEPEGNMVIDIGGGTTEIAVIALMGIVCDESIRVAGDEFTLAIVDYIRRQHNMLIGERTAERIKIHVGSALDELPEDIAPEPYAVNGRDLMTGVPKQIHVGYQEITKCLNVSISKIEEAVLRALEATPPELAADIYEKGIHLTGGGALLRGLNIRLARKTKLEVRVADDPLRAVVRGTGEALKSPHKYPFLISK
ncbi:UNVERIFIED_CONTAM: hypothetical protein GTU68_003725 [Idotea baltica]|nr:hypothetical protein [Idotea baltica]